LSGCGVGVEGCDGWGCGGGVVRVGPVGAVVCPCGLISEGGVCFTHLPRTRDVPRGQLQLGGVPVMPGGQGSV